MIDFRQSMIFAIPAILFVTSCANYVPLNHPHLFAELEDESLSEVASVIFPQRRWGQERLLIKRIDGIKIEKFKIDKGTYQVPSGKRKVRIDYVVTRRATTIASATAYLEVDFNAGRRYVPLAKRNRNSVRIWMIDVWSREVASDVISVETKTPIPFDTTSGE